jgi:hypothetical protein
MPLSEEVTQAYTIVTSFMIRIILCEHKTNVGWSKINDQVIYQSMTPGIFTNDDTIQYVYRIDKCM